MVLLLILVIFSPLSSATSTFEIMALNAMIIALFIEPVKANELDATGITIVVLIVAIFLASLLLVIWFSLRSKASRKGRSETKGLTGGHSHLRYTDH